MRGLDSYPAVALAQPAAANLLSRQGGDVPPAGKPTTPSVPTFAEAAARIIESRRPTWSNPKHAQQWANTLKYYANRVIGYKRVDEITTAMY